VQQNPLTLDVAQTAFVGAFERIQQFDSRRPFAPRFFKLVLGDARRVAERRARLGSRLRE
jgi:hypothetical protein